MVEVECVAPIGVHAALPGGMPQYKDMYERSTNPETCDEFWREQAEFFIHWMKPFESVRIGGFEVGDHAWFVGGQLNVSACCLDKHLPALATKPAIIWEGDEPGVTSTLNYGEVLNGTCRIANALRVNGARKGDFITVYMPMVPETAMAMLACTRIGAPHTVVFAGFTASSLRDRIQDSSSKWVLTSDVGRRGSKTIKLKEITDAAVAQCPEVRKVFVFKRTGEDVPYSDETDVHMDRIILKMRPYCPPTPVDAEETLFTLYTFVCHCCVQVLRWMQLEVATTV